MPRGKAPKSLELIEACVAILREIQPCSVRAVCYQLFNCKLIASMAKKDTNRVSAQLTYARKAGHIPWEWIVDESRAAEVAATWDNPEQFAAVMVRSYRRDRWQAQPRRVEVWSEKGTVRGTLAPVLHAYGVDFRVMHGYSSTTVVHDVAEATAGLATPLAALYVGDWDPSGLHMSEADLPTRLREAGARVDLHRVALTLGDVLDGTLPSFSVETKRTDTRYGWFVERYRDLTGDRCWELDALNPVVLRERVKRAIVHLIDAESWNLYEAVERVEHASLVDVLSRWTPRIPAPEPLPS